MICFVQSRKKADRSQSSQVNTENRENSNYELIDTNQSSETVSYKTLASTETSSPPDHPGSDSVYEEIDDDYLNPAL